MPEKLPPLSQLNATERDPAGLSQQSMPLDEHNVSLHLRANDTTMYLPAEGLVQQVSVLDVGDRTHELLHTEVLAVVTDEEVHRARVLRDLVPLREVDWRSNGQRCCCHNHHRCHHGYGRDGRVCW